ncbi:MAG: PhoU domain-containing protein [Eubacteriales bacterium]
MHDKKISFSEFAQAEIKVFSAALTEILNNAVDAFLNENLDEARMVEPLEEVIDALQAEIRARQCCVCAKAPAPSNWALCSPTC